MEGKWVLQQINKRLAGEMSDSDWIQFQQLVEEASKHTPGVCSKCANSGQVYHTDTNGIRTIYLCPCPLGEAQKKTLYSPSDKDKSHPIEVSTLRNKPEKRDWKRDPKEWD